VSELEVEPEAFEKQCPHGARVLLELGAKTELFAECVLVISNFAVFKQTQTHPFGRHSDCNATSDRIILRASPLSVQASFPCKHSLCRSMGCVGTRSCNANVASDCNDNVASDCNANVASDCNANVAPDCNANVASDCNANVASDCNAKVASDCNANVASDCYHRSYNGLSDRRCLADHRHHRRCRYLRSDGMVKRVTQFADAEMAEKLTVASTYSQRKDRLTHRLSTFTDEGGCEQIDEHFLTGRPSEIKLHTHFKTHRIGLPEKGR
jgi:hypothetical protein